MQSIIIKNKNVRFEQGRPATLQPGVATDATDANGEPLALQPELCEKSARLLESDGLVHAIELSCSCGEVTLIELDYAEPDSAETASLSEKES